MFRCQGRYPENVNEKNFWCTNTIHGLVTMYTREKTLEQLLSWKARGGGGGGGGGGGLHI